MCTVSPKDVQRFHLKLILNVTAGATKFEDLRTHDGVLFSTYKDAALAIGLIKNEKIIFEMFDKACQVMLPHQLQQYFALFLCHDHPANPREIWAMYKKYFTEDFTDNAEYRALRHISCILQAENVSCTDCGLPKPDVDVLYTEPLGCVVLIFQRILM